MIKATVVKSTGSRYSVITQDNKQVECSIKGVFRLKGIKTTNPVAVGDKVEIEMADDGSGVINKIEERKNYIIRKSINLSKQYHIIAANMDQAMLVVTLALPRTSTGFIDRFLLTAEAYHIPAIILFNKADYFESDKGLMDELDEFIAVYKKIGYPCYKVSAINANNLEVIRTITKNKTTLLAGHSGVGKSTLINALDNNLNIKTGELSEAHSKGKHTTTFAEMHPLAYGGFIIDSPGIKELGLVDMQKEEICDYFPEMRAIKNECKFNNCIHINEPKCAVVAAVANGDIAQSRYNNYLGILNGEELEPNYD
jgi:ribosome biogenesis GTPase / thiamine phosphate phosphatase